jgi:nicotinic acetylcholine receptor beta-1
MQWTDPRLSWNPNDYNGTNEITLPVNKIWVPDIVIQVNNFNLFMKNYFFDST